jgi:NAD(P)H-dependent flavin oxidoreductase YrpB (nitropropane dioxygenase family)
VEKHVPVTAAGTIADERRLAAALLLGPQAISAGTRFLASPKTAIREDFKVG